MVVTDLHGDWDAYQRYRDCFVDLHAAGRADCLIFTGDLIHREDGGPDQSLEIVQDVMALQSKYGQAVICLCGNHEMVHIYGISLAKGNQVFTPAFEAALSRCGCRPEVIALFDSLPFYLRTPAGVVITHAGAAAPMAEPGKAQQLFNWDHQQFLAWADKIMMTEDIEALRRGYARMSGLPYEQLADHYLAVSGPDDPRYDDLLRGFLATSQPLFDQLLWPALFTRCEHEYGRTDYAIFLDALLQELSIDFSPQQILIAGHISINGGHKIIAKRHLRLASAHHAIPRKAGQYLLFDTAEPVLEPKNLVAGLRSVYP
jgi:hypothetical protein